MGSGVQSQDLLLKWRTMVTREGPVLHFLYWKCSQTVRNCPICHLHFWLLNPRITKVWTTSWNFCGVLVWVWLKCIALADFGQWVRNNLLKSSSFLMEGRAGYRKLLFIIVLNFPDQWTARTFPNLSHPGIFMGFRSFRLAASCSPAPTGTVSSMNRDVLRAIKMIEVPGLYSSNMARELTIIRGIKKNFHCWLATSHEGQWPGSLCWREWKAKHRAQSIPSHHVAAQGCLYLAE